MKVTAVILTVFALAIASNAQGKEIQQTTLDVLFLYSDAVVELYQGGQNTRINHLIETTNTIFEDSELNIIVRPVNIASHSIDDQITPYQLMTKAANDPDLSELRDTYGADVIILMRPKQLDQPCGLSYRPSSIEGLWRGLAFVSVDCASYITAHELGHTMGLGHSHAQNSEALLPYALGHGNLNRFATVMAYSNAYNAPKVYKFSSPRLSCRGIPCGIEIGEPLSADAVTALEQTAPIVESLQVSKIDQQCENSDIIKRIENEYFVAKAKLDKETETLSTINQRLEGAKTDYIATLTEYRALASESYYPAYQTFTQTKKALVSALIHYKETGSTPDTLQQLYQAYKKSYKLFLLASETIKSFYKDVYQAAIHLLRNQLTARKTQSAIVKEIDAQYLLLKQAYSETLAAYQCYNITL